MKRHLICAAAFFLRLLCCIAIFCISGSAKLSLFFAAEMLVLSAGILALGKGLRWVLLPLLVVHVLQFVNLVLTGQYVLPATLENANYGGLIEKTVYYASAIGVGYLFLWIPSFFAPAKLNFKWGGGIVIAHCLLGDLCKADADPSV